jgi:hypothetical protein
MKRIEKLIKLFLIIFCILLIVSQYLILNTDINTYVNPVYEYIGVFKSLP